jgi:hypothetical protein
MRIKGNIIVELVFEGCEICIGCGVNDPFERVLWGNKYVIDGIEVLSDVGLVIIVFWLNLNGVIRFGVRIESIWVVGSLIPLRI